MTALTPPHPPQHPVVILSPCPGVRALMLVVERSPWPTLTLAISLEAIFRSAFVMIGQNRQGAFQQAKADHDFVEGSRN